MPLFTADLINSSKFHKYLPLRYGIYALLFVLVWLLIGAPASWFSNQGADFIWADKLGLDVIHLLIALVVTVGIAYALHEGHRDVRSLGTLDIYQDKLRVHYDGHPSKEFLYTDVTNLTIRRRSSWQHEGRKENYLVEFGSVVEFHTIHDTYSFEFHLPSETKNKEFEAMIHTLQQRRVKFLYTSV
ncbi:hypothetical protein [Lewinella sp. 4G2]|uniref:hypothetical protein n=1 Tax=Lewinella sp. 4G2 TaxID=1803372 RepID=UPI0007B49636|nr:hypothetical protein [Lewinella sp. 4G2]OAV45161.1 hypothetical protein A3850_011960 [Lewinella sp. 4G2]